METDGGGNARRFTLRPEALQVISGMPCFKQCYADEPLRCVDDQWDGRKRCNHVNIYAPRPHGVLSWRACSRLVGHTLSVMRLLEEVALKYRGVPGVVLMLEDDGSLRSRWDELLSATRPLTALRVECSLSTHYHPSVP